LAFPGTTDSSVLRFSLPKGNHYVVLCCFELACTMSISSKRNDVVLRDPLQPHAPFHIHHVNGDGGVTMNSRRSQENPGLTDDEFRGRPWTSSRSRSTDHQTLTRRKGTTEPWARKGLQGLRHHCQHPKRKHAPYA
jgi:hypothetical protein